MKVLIPTIALLLVVSNAAPMPIADEYHVVDIEHQSPDQDAMDYVRVDHDEDTFAKYLSPRESIRQPKETFMQRAKKRVASWCRRSSSSKCREKSLELAETQTETSGSPDLTSAIPTSVFDDSHALALPKPYGLQNRPLSWDRVREDDYGIVLTGVMNKQRSLQRMAMQNHRRAARPVIINDDDLSQAGSIRVASRERLWADDHEYDTYNENTKIPNVDSWDFFYHFNEVDP